MGLWLTPLVVRLKLNVEVGGEHLSVPDDSVVAVVEGADNDPRPKGGSWLASRYCVTTSFVAGGGKKPASTRIILRRVRGRLGIETADCSGQCGRRHLVQRSAKAEASLFAPGQKDTSLSVLMQRRRRRRCRRELCKIPATRGQGEGSHVKAVCWKITGLPSHHGYESQRRVLCGVAAPSVRRAPFWQQMGSLRQLVGRTSATGSRV